MSFPGYEPLKLYIKLFDIPFFDGIQAIHFEIRKGIHDPKKIPQTSGSRLHGTPNSSQLVLLVFSSSLKEIALTCGNKDSHRYTPPCTLQFHSHKSVMRLFILMRGKD